MTLMEECCKTKTDEKKEKGCCGECPDAKCAGCKCSTEANEKPGCCMGSGCGCAAKDDDCCE
jgi:hypothetical protein